MKNGEGIDILSDTIIIWSEAIDVGGDAINIMGETIDVRCESIDPWPDTITVWGDTLPFSNKDKHFFSVSWFFHLLLFFAKVRRFLKFGKMLLGEGIRLSSKKASR